MTPIHDRAARELLSPLAGEPGGTQWLDVDRIVRDGGRRRRARTVGTGALTAVFLLTLAAGATAVVVSGRRADGVPATPDGAASASAPTGPDCTLSALAGPTGLLAAADHTGHYTLQEVSGDNKTTAIVRKDGVKVAAVKIPAPAGGDYDLNARGEFTAIIADVRQDHPAVFSFAYTAGKLTRLTGDDVAVAVADDGRIAGTVKNAPAIWQRPAAAPDELKVARGEQAQVISVDQDGTVLGYAHIEASQFANLWLPDGSSRAIPVVQGQGPPSVVGIANGWVAGFDTRNGFRYNVATRKYEALPAQIMHPHAVASNGAVVGDGTDGSLYVLNGGVARKLPQTPGMQHYTVLGISDDGRTVTANEYFPSPKSDPAQETGRAVTWTCG